MPDPLILPALSASRYEAADPATLAEVERNEAIADLHRVLAEQAAEQREMGKVLPMRIGERR
jgi:hypothetical protein